MTPNDAKGHKNVDYVLTTRHQIENSSSANEAANVSGRAAKKYRWDREREKTKFKMELLKMCHI